MTTVHIPDDLDKIFEALANEHRRDIIYLLSLQPHSITQLALMRDISLPAIHKHIRILEDAGMIIRKKIGRTHFLGLNRKSLGNLQNWLMQYHVYWGNNEETFENYLLYINKKSVKGGDNMKKFILIFYGKIRPEDINKDEMQATMDKWMAWFGTFKDQMVDGGNPFASNAKSVTAKGVENISADMWPAKGYTIINATDIGEATEIAKECPALKDDPEGAVRVYEAIPM